MAKRPEPALAGGIYAALLTPRKAGSADADAAALLDYLDRPIKAGVDGLVLFGSTGEFIHFDPTERSRVATLAIRRSRVPVLVNITHSTMVGTVALAESSIKAGASGLLLMPPYFYRYSEDDIAAFYREVASIVDAQLPLYLYNLPAFTNALSFPLIRKLLTLPGIAGIKDSSGDPELLANLLDLRTDRDFRLLIGDESRFTEGRKKGADGCVSGISAALPELLVALDKALTRGDYAIIQQLQGHLYELMHWVQALPPVCAIRETAAFRNWIKNEPVLPTSPRTETQVTEFRSWLKTYLPAVLQECSPPGP